MQGLGGAAPGLRLFFRLFAFLGLPELLDQSGPLLRRGLGNGCYSLLCGLDAAGKNLLFDARSNFFCSVYTFGKMLCTAYMSCRCCTLPILLCNLPKFGGHDSVEFQVLGEPVHKGQDDVAIKQQPFAFAEVGHITELMGRDIELFGEDLPVAGGLVAHWEKIPRSLPKSPRFEICQTGNKKAANLFQTYCFHWPPVGGWYSVLNMVGGGQRSLLAAP